MKRFVTLYILAFLLSGLTFSSCQRSKTVSPTQNIAIPQKKASCCSGKTPARFALKIKVPTVQIDTLSKMKYNKP